MNPRKSLNKIRNQKKRRSRAKIFGTADKPRFSIFRSNYYTSGQLIDDETGKTLVGASTREIEKLKVKNPARAEATAAKQESKVALAEQLGEFIAQKAAEKGIKKVVFDRGRYRYHGRVRAVAEGARKGGLQF